MKRFLSTLTFFAGFAIVATAQTKQPAAKPPVKKATQTTAVKTDKPSLEKFKKAAEWIKGKVNSYAYDYQVIKNVYTDAGEKASYTSEIFRAMKITEIDNNYITAEEEYELLEVYLGWDGEYGYFPMRDYKQTITYKIPIKSISQIGIVEFQGDEAEVRSSNNTGLEKKNKPNCIITTMGNDVITKITGENKSWSYRDRTESQRSIDQTKYTTGIPISLPTNVEENFIVRFNKAANDMMDYIKTLQKEDY